MWIDSIYNPTNLLFYVCWEWFDGIFREFHDRQVFGRNESNPIQMVMPLFLPLTHHILRFISNHHYIPNRLLPLCFWKSIQTVPQRGSPPLWSVCWWFFSDPHGSPNLTSSIYPLCSHNPNSCIRCKSTDLSWRPPIGPLILKCCQFYKVVPPRYPLVNKHRYWKWPFIVDLFIKNGDFP